MVALGDAQPVDCSRSDGVQSWTVIFSLTGSGEGLVMGVPGLTYVNQQSATGSFKFGPSNPCVPGLVLASGLTEIENFLLSVDLKLDSEPLTQIIQGTSVNPFGGLLTIDTNVGTYSLWLPPTLNAQTTQIFHQEEGDIVIGPLPGIASWGPPQTASGSPSTGLPITNIPLPGSGTTLSGSQQYRGMFGIRVKTGHKRGCPKT